MGSEFSISAMTFIRLSLENGVNDSILYMERIYDMPLEIKWIYSRSVLKGFFIFHVKRNDSFFLDGFDFFRSLIKWAQK